MPPLHVVGKKKRRPSCNSGDNYDVRERTNEGAKRYAVDFFLLDGEKISLRPGFLVGSDAKIRRGF